MPLDQSLVDAAIQQALSDVEVAVAVPGEPGQWQAKRLAELQPHYWRNAVTDAGE